MVNCTCSNCTFTGDGKRYCYDCGKYTKMPSRDTIEDMIASKRLKEAKEELE